jgi:hypothetical protein
MLVSCNLSAGRVEAAWRLKRWPSGRRWQTFALCSASTDMAKGPSAVDLGLFPQRGIWRCTRSGNEALPRISGTIGKSRAGRGEEGIQMKGVRIAFARRWRVAVPVCAAIAAIAAAAAPGTTQAAGASPSGESATAREATARLPVAPTPPMRGYTPAATGDEYEEHIYYTGSDRAVYGVSEINGVWATTASRYGGRLIGGPAVAGFLLGRFTDNKLWYRPVYTWASLGGRLTSRPGATGVAVAARGTDGAVWVKQATYHQGIPTWGNWRSLGGRVLAGSGPAVVGTLPHDTLYVLAVGTDRAVWVRQTTDGTHWTKWRSLGGRVTGDLGVAAPGPKIVFARGTDNAAWYNQFAGKTAGVKPGWHRLGGRLTSGLGAWGGHHTDIYPQETLIVAMGTDNHIWRRAGNWPKLGPWTRVSITGQQ